MEKPRLETKVGVFVLIGLVLFGTAFLLAREEVRAIFHGHRHG